MARSVTVVVAGIFFLNATGIGKADSREPKRRSRAVNRSGKSISYEAWDVSDVVEVRMSHHQRIDFAGRDEEGKPVARSKLPAALKEPAVNQNFSAVER